MKQWTLPSRSLPLDDRWDVVVAGGGPAGCTAAAAAAREGARTLLIESTGSLGGMGTSGLIPAWCPFTDKERVIYGGLAERVLNESKATTPHEPKEKVDWVAINPEALKRIYDDLVTSHGAKVLFGTTLAAVHAENGVVDTLIIANKSGLSAIKAPIYIDCTGDADLAAWAGAQFHKGNAAGEKLMPATHCFMLSNVDDYAYRTGPQLHGGNRNSPMYQVVASGKYPLIPDVHCCQNLVGPSTVGFNAGHLWNVDNTDPVSMSQAMITGRKMAAQFRDALAECHPAFRNAFLASTGSLMGIRETRRIVGDYELTLEDYMARRTFEDEICRNSYFIDVHWAKEDATVDPKLMEKWEKTTVHYGKGESHGIPYRCLSPKGLKNVLVAGRSISCQQIVQGSVRVMPVCLAMGEAAGVAAAMAGKCDCHDIHQVNVQDLRGRLVKYGAYIK